jgi:hypothetical protein
MVSLAQDEPPYDPRILKTVARENAVRLGMYAEALAPGAVRIGDSIQLL